MKKLPSSHENAIHYFRREGSENIHIRFSVRELGKHKQIRRSTGEVDYDRARKKADTLFKKYLGKAEAGLKLSHTSFRKVAQGYCNECAQAVDDEELSNDAYKAERSRVERYFIGFFGDDPIEEIKQPHIDKFIRWRKTYWTSGPGKKEKTITYQRGPKTITRKVNRTKPSQATLLKEINTLRSIFSYAVREGILQEGDKLSIVPPRGKVNRRASFDDHEIDALHEHLYNRVFEDGLSRDERLKRYELAAYVSVAISSGMRPKEIVNLKWNGVIGVLDGADISLKKMSKLPSGKYDLRFIIFDTKRDVRRRIVPLKSIPATILNYWEFTGKRTDNSLVFADQKENAVKSYGDAVISELKRIGIRQNANGENRSQYSFRHYYITRMIRSGRSPAFIAQNVGTSIEMIEKHYLHGDIEQYAEQLGEW